MTTLSFCHYGNAEMASYRYRCLMPARELQASINDQHADVLVFSKPVKNDVHYAVKAHRRGGKVIVDICDWHFDQPHYRMLVGMADVVTCPTPWMAEYLRTDYGIEAVVIPDPYEFAELPAHCNGDGVLWFGNATNYGSLSTLRPYLDGVDLTVVSNVDGDVPWSLANLAREFARASIVIMPETLPYKSANRTIEALRQGCFVAADPHPSLEEFADFIYIGSIRKGIEWAQRNRSEANRKTSLGQDYIRSRFAPQTLASAWRNAVNQALACISDVEVLSGTDG